MPTSPPRDPNDPGPVDLTDPAVRTAWLGGVRSHVEDLIGAAMDQTEPIAGRDVGRREARRIIGDAASALRHALDAAGAPPVADADRAILRRAVRHGTA